MGRTKQNINFWLKTDPVAMYHTGLPTYDEVVKTT